jgi:hypothetical protein
MIALGWGLIGSAVLSLGCLIAGIKSLVSITQGYDRESRTMAIVGFFAGLIASAVFAWIFIKMLGTTEAMTNALTG